MIRQAWRHALPLWGVVLLLSGCAAVRNYDAELYVTLERASTGASTTRSGCSSRTTASPTRTSSTTSSSACCSGWAAATRKARRRGRARAARIEAERGRARRGIRRRARRLELCHQRQAARLPGHDYEKVMLLTYMALNHLAMGDYDGARVAIKQAHELEAQIAELRAKQYAEIEESARKRGAHELQGAERLPDRDHRHAGSQRAAQRLPERAVALPRRLHLRGARRAEPGRAGIPPGERAAARPAAAGGSAARPRRARRRPARRWNDRRADDRRHRIRAGDPVAPVHAAGGDRQPLVLLANAFPVMTATSWAPLPTEVALDGAELPGGAHHEHRPHGAPPADGRHAGDHAARHDPLDPERHAPVPGAARVRSRARACDGARREHRHRGLDRARLGRRPHLARAALGRVDRPGARAAGVHTITLHTPDGPRSAA